MCIFFKSSPFFPVNCNLDPHVVALNPSFTWFISLFLIMICLRKSLMSSSHLFFGLPIIRLVLYFELSSGFHSAAFFTHLSLGDVAILEANFPFHLPVCFVPASNLCVFHLVDCVSCASSYIVEPVFFFNLSRVDVFFWVFIEWCSAVHVIFRFGALVIAAFVINATVFSFVVISFFNRVLDNLFFNFFVFSFRLNDEAPASCVESIESSFRVHGSETMFQMRSKESGRPWRRRDASGVWACISSMLIPVCISGMLSMLLWSYSWFRLSPVDRKRFSDPNISRFHFLPIFLCQCHRFSCIFLCRGSCCFHCLRIFVLFGWIVRPTFSVASLNSHIMFCICPFGCCEQHHVVGESQVRQAVSFLVAQVDTHSFFLCHFGTTFFNAYCSTVLKSRLDSGSPCLEPFWISKISLSSSVCNDAFWSL